MGERSVTVPVITRDEAKALLEFCAKQYIPYAGPLAPLHDLLAKIDRWLAQTEAR